MPADATGSLREGCPHSDLSASPGDEQFDPGESTTVWPACHDPVRRRFVFTYRLRGILAEDRWML